MNVISWAQVAIIVAGYLLAVLYQTHHPNKRIDDLRSEMNHRFEDLIRYADQRFKNIEDLVRSEGKRLEDKDRVLKGGAAMIEFSLEGGDVCWLT